MLRRDRLKKVLRVIDLLPERMGVIPMNRRSLTRFGLNLQFVEAETLLQDSDEIVFIPPVSGG